MADLEDIDLTAPADSLYSGGVKINLIRTRVDALYTVLSSITSAEADQIEAIGTSTISAAQWGYLGACGAGGGQLLAALTASESTQLEAIGATTISAAQWGYLGACGTGGGQLLAALTTAESTQLEAIGTTTISAAQWGYLGACVAGGGQLLAALTATESTQLEAIGTTTISATQWGYLGALNQGLTTTSTVTFGTINAFTLGGKLTAGAVEIEGSAFDINGGTIDGITSLTAAGALDIGAYGFRANTLTADGLTSGRLVRAGTAGLLGDATVTESSGALGGITTLSMTGNLTVGGTVDGVDVADHTDRHKEFGADAVNIKDTYFAQFPDLCEWEWATLDGWTENTTETGTTSLIYSRLRLETGTTSGAVSQVYSGIALWLKYSEAAYRVRITARLIPQTGMPTNAEVWFGAFADPASISATQDHIAFHIKSSDGSLYASCADGTTETEVDTDINVVINTSYNLFIKYMADDVKFYVDEVLKATISTNRPTSANTGLTLWVTNEEAANKKIDLFSLKTVSGAD